MRTISRFILTLPLALPLAALAADSLPVLQWVQTTGGSGLSTVAAAVSDANGNLYIAGSTTSLDFPTTSTASEAAAGGSSLARVTLATGAATRLYPGNLPPITIAAAGASNPNIIYAASSNQIWKSSDAGSTWSLAYQFATGVAVGALAVDPTNSSTVYAGTGTLGVFKSTDGGNTWMAISNGVPPNPNGSTNAQGGLWVDPSSPNVIFAGVDGEFERSEDGGNTWTTVAAAGSYTVVAFDPLSPATVLLADGGAISKSNDTGETFSALPSLPANVLFFALAADPHNEGVLYAGTSGGIYEFTGGAWTQKMPGVSSALVADPNSSAFYATLASPGLSAYGIVKSTDGFNTVSPAGIDEPQVGQLLVAGSNLFEIAASTTDVFVVKLDNNGNVVYSTYFGGSGNDAAAALAVGADGSVYVTGITTSADLPVSAGAYQTAFATNTQQASFVFKLNPNGSRAWATYFANPQNTAASIAVDATGNPIIGGYSSGNLPTTTGAYQTSFTQTLFCTGFIGCFPGPEAAFVTKFNAQGTGLIFSTYIATDTQNHGVEGAQAMVLDAAGDVWIGVGNPTVLFGTSANGFASALELNSTGTAVLGSAFQPGLGSVTAIALDGSSNVYVAGSYDDAGGFPATSGAFQTAPQPAVPSLAYQAAAGGGSDAFVAKFDNSLTHLLAATLFGGELPDGANSIAIDSNGNVIISGLTDSKALPTHAPFQELFSVASGFVAGFDPTLSNLLFSTYLGNGTPFSAQSAVPDGAGNILLAGNTLSNTGPFIGGNNGASYTGGGMIVANKISLAPAPAIRLDSVQNYADHLANPLAPGEPITATGAGFESGAQIVVDGSPLATLSATATSITAVMPAGATTTGAHTVQIANNGSMSNSVWAPAAEASPAIYSVDGSGFGQAYVLNANGTMNSAANPASPGSAITIYVAGPGPYTLSNGYAVTALTPAVFLDGFYCDGIAAVIGPVSGLPGNVYQIGVYIPSLATLVANDPDLKNFTFPAQSPIQIVMGTLNSSNPANSQTVSQTGIYVSIGGQ